MSADRFAEQVRSLDEMVQAWRDEGALRELVLPARAWPVGRRLVLGADAALDLGSSAAGSRAFLLWDSGATAGEHELWLAGPDVPELVELGTEDVGLGLVILARGSFDEEYDLYLGLKEALYGLTLDGLTLRSMPSQAHLWMRLHRDAAADGFCFAHLGAALVEALGAVAGVHQLQIGFVAGDEERLAALGPLSEDVQRHVAALVKRHEVVDAECDDCAYQDICDEREHRT